MDRPASPIKHGSLSGYGRGCRCDECRSANAKKQARYNARKRGLGEPPPRPEEQSAQVTPLPVQPAAPPESEGPGEVELATLAELETLSAAKARPASVARAIALARLLDRVKLSSTHPSAARQHAAAMNEIRAASVGRPGRLAAVSAMSRSSSAGVAG